MSRERGITAVVGVVLAAAAASTDASVCRECRDDKHVNCTGWAIDTDTDAVVDCDCVDESHPWNRS